MHGNTVNISQAPTLSWPGITSSLVSHGSQNDITNSLILILLFDTKMSQLERRWKIWMVNQCYTNLPFVSIFFIEKDGHETRSNREHFRDVAVNPLIPGSIYLFPGSVFVCNIMEKRMNGFSWNLHETPGTTQEIISETVSYASIMFHGLPSGRTGRVC